MRVERRCAEPAAEVGHAHAREHPAPEAIRRIGAGAAEDGRADPRRREPLPDRRPPPQVHRLRGQERRSSARSGSGRCPADRSRGRGGGSRRCRDRPGWSRSRRWTRPPASGRGSSSRPGARPPAGRSLARFGQLARGEHRLDDGRLEPIQADHDDFPGDRHAARSDAWRSSRQSNCSNRSVVHASRRLLGPLYPFRLQFNACRDLGTTGQPCRRQRV